MVKKHLPLFEFLVRADDKQIAAILKTLSEQQLKAVLEAVYNVSKGICPLPNKTKKQLFEYKNVIRRLVSKELNREQQRRLLKKHQHLLPLVLKPVIKFLNNDE
jgi:hypothetical protein